MLLKQYRDIYLDFFLGFLWREWTALGVQGQTNAPVPHAIDPEALLLLTCTFGRYDPRLFDEVMDWLMTNGRFLNVQRMNNILHREAFQGGAVLGAVAAWLARHGVPVKWDSLIRHFHSVASVQPLFYLPDGRALPQSKEDDAVFLENGWQRNPVHLRGYAQSFPARPVSSLFLKMRALFGINTRSDVLTYLLLNQSGHPRAVAREIFYSQKTIHEVMTDLECSDLLQSSKGARERIFRITAKGRHFLTGGQPVPPWINWPILLATAETIWHKINELVAHNGDALVQSSEIVLTAKPLLQRLVRMSWAPSADTINSADPMELLHAFLLLFEAIISPGVLPDRLKRQSLKM